MTLMAEPPARSARQPSSMALPALLPTIFTYTQARAAGLNDRDLRSARSNGLIDMISRGLYERQDRPPLDTDLAQIAIRSPQATLCLRTALGRHDLIDDIPDTIDVALPRGQRAAAVSAPVTWHRFDPDTFAIGREPLELDKDLTLHIYDPMRCIIDAFRLAHREGHELGHIALKTWLRQRGNHPADLIAMAKSFPSVRTAIHNALTILL